MLFSSAIFLFYFLPLLLLIYFCVGNTRIKNHVLLLFSFIFFLWGGVWFTLIVVASIIFNFFTAKAIQRLRSRASVGFAVAGNLAVLIIFKYGNFIVDDLNWILPSLHLSSPGIVLPIGISFYTFHSISYNIDVYKGKARAQENVFDMALYIILFSQLVAGPIIRYNIFEPQLFGRKHSFEKFALGVERFIIGLGKKVLIANTIARVANDAFAQNAAHMDQMLSWLGIFCYTLQIYFDFSGYSDMAIGLSKMFGFDFPENFNLPYIAKSVKDFWTRWHISLSSFFRDYLYIPLGGNKKGEGRTVVNLLIVFFLTGLWHGANHTFIVWGMIHGSFLLLERTSFGKVLDRLPGIIRILYTFFVVMMAWIPFRADTLGYAINYWESLISAKADLQLVSSYFTTDVVVAILLGTIFAFGSFPRNQIQYTALRSSFQLVRAILLIVILSFCAVYLLSGTYNPFIYYQF